MAAALRMIHKITGELIDRSMMNKVIVELTKKFGGEATAPEPSEISAAIDAFLGEETMRATDEELQDPQQGAAEEVGLDSLRIADEEEEGAMEEEEYDEGDDYGGRRTYQIRVGR